MTAWTEAEAREKWCPFARIADESGILTINRESGSRVRPSCLGAECMAWRWDMPEGSERRRGYCGVAGKPDWSR